MLNMTSATASAGSTPAGIAAAACATAGVDRVDAAQAAKRPLAGTGAGAFTREGTLTGFRTREAAVLALPRLRWAVAAGSGLSGNVSSQQFHNSNQMTRSYPIPGGVGPHPAREPDPV